MEYKHHPKEELEKLATGTNRKAAVDGDVEQGMVQAGQSLLPLKRVQPAAEIVNEIMEDAKAALQQAPSLL